MKAHRFSTAKKTLVGTKKFAPKVIGNERAKLLTDDEMVGMHKHKKGPGIVGKSTPAHILPRATMMFKAREA